ncbi:MAG TPA: hypothetical protein PKW31_06470, partial [Synergistales bacterium]|nr:hypothetical protein [Synergistales bacterium]
LGLLLRPSGLLAKTWAKEHDDDQPVSVANHLQFSTSVVARSAAHSEAVGKPTNMVYVQLGPDGPDAAELSRRCSARGVLFGAVSERRFRLVTHFGVTKGEVDLAGRTILEELKAS